MLEGRPIMGVLISWTADTSDATGVLDNLLEKIAAIRGDHSITVGATAPYARYVEYGHAVRSGWKIKGPVVGEVPPHPFLRPAADAIADQVADALTEAFNSGDSGDDALQSKQTDWKELAQSFAPVRTGRLRDSIYVTVG
jgi:phage gpG-like protein